MQWFHPLSNPLSTCYCNKPDTAWAPSVWRGSLKYDLCSIIWFDINSPGALCFCDFSMWSVKSDNSVSIHWACTFEVSGYGLVPELFIKLEELDWTIWCGPMLEMVVTMPFTPFLYYIMSLSLWWCQLSVVLINLITPCTYSNTFNIK